MKHVENATHTITCLECGHEINYIGQPMHVACPKCELIQAVKYICVDHTRKSLSTVKGTYEENSDKLFNGDTAKLIKLHPNNDGGKCDCGLFEIDRTKHVEYYFLDEFKPIGGDDPLYM